MLPEVADQTCHFTQSQYTDTGPASPSTDAEMLGWQGSHYSTGVKVSGLTGQGKAGTDPRVSHSGGGPFTTTPWRWTLYHYTLEVDPLPLHPGSGPFTTLPLDPGGGVSVKVTDQSSQSHQLASFAWVFSRTAECGFSTSCYASS